MITLLDWLWRRLLGLPPAPESTIKQHSGGELVPLRVRQAELRVEEPPLGVEHLEVAGDAALVPVERELRRTGARLHLIGPRHSRFPELSDAHGGIGGLLQRLLHRLPVLRDRLLKPRARRLFCRRKPPALEDGSQEAATGAPLDAVGFEEVRNRGRL